MIRKRTVFVLGAGASAPYGFPLGGALAQKLVRLLEKHSELLLRLHKAGFSQKSINQFRKELSESGRGSIDAFLEMRQDHLDIGKACIAGALIPCEKDTELAAIVEDGAAYDHEVEERRSRRWYHYLFDQMLMGGSFTSNRLAVITFNFDRSFERTLYRTLRANYGDDERRVVELCSSIPIVHIHGALGACEWLSTSDGSRKYGGAYSENDLLACAKRINVVTDDADHGLLEQARSLLEDAEVVCFLGFSFHPLNLRKLDYERTIVARNQVVRGTAFKMPGGPRNRVVRDFTRTQDGSKRLHLYPSDWDVLRFLEETNVIHD